MILMSQNMPILLNTLLHFFKVYSLSMLVIQKQIAMMIKMIDKCICLLHCLHPSIIEAQINVIPIANNNHMLVHAIQ